MRRADVIEKIKSGPSVQQYLDHIESAIVPDNTIDGAYDDAVSGAKYIVHIAGSWPLPVCHV